MIVLIDSYFDASAPYTPLAPDEEEIDVTPENLNANSSGGNASTKSGAVLNDLCFGGAPNTGTRAERERKTIVALQPVNSVTCDDIEEIRLNSVNAAALAYKGVARRGDLFQVTLGGGVIETWEFIAGGNMAGGTILNVSPVSSGCPGY